MGHRRCVPMIAPKVKGYVFKLHKGSYCGFYYGNTCLSYDISGAQVYPAASFKHINTPNGWGGKYQGKWRVVYEPG